MKATTENQEHVCHDEIANRAREIWEREGRQAGRDLEYWLRAERELLASRNQTHNYPSAPEAAATEQSPRTRRTGKGSAPTSQTVRI